MVTNTIIKDIKRYNLPMTFFVNLGQLGYPMFIFFYVIVIINHLDSYNFSDPILKIPFLILFLGSVLYLIKGYNPCMAIVLKSKRKMN